MYCLEKASCLRHREEKSRQSPAVSLNWGNGAGSLGEPRQFEFTGQSTGRRERGRHTQRELWGSVGVSIEYSVGYYSWGQQKHHTKGLEGALSRAYTGPGTVPVPGAAGESLRDVRHQSTKESRLPSGGRLISE